MELNIVAVNRDTELAAMYHDIKSVGLRKCIEIRLNEIDNWASRMSYLDHRYIQEQCTEILDLLDISEEIREEEVKRDDRPAKD